MQKKKRSPEKGSKERFFRSIPSTVPGKTWISLNPLKKNYYFRPIEIMFPADEPRAFFGIPSDSYIERRKKEQLFPLIDAINGENEIVLRFNLNAKRGPIVEDFKKLLTTAYDELKRHKREMPKFYELDYDKYLKVYNLKKKHPKWTWVEIAQEVFPGDFDNNVLSAIEKTREFYEKAKEKFENRK
jgi:hypothetical protein